MTVVGQRQSASNDTMPPYINMRQYEFYTEVGNPIDFSFYDVDGGLCLNLYGVARWTAAYDGRDNQIEQTNYGRFQ